MCGRKCRLIVWINRCKADSSCTMAACPHKPLANGATTCTGWATTIAKNALHISRADHQWICNWWPKRLKRMKRRQVLWFEHDNYCTVWHRPHSRLAAIQNPTGFIWDEIHPVQGPPGWDAAKYWPWENVRLLLTFIPSRMKAQKIYLMNSSAKR